VAYSGIEKLGLGCFLWKSLIQVQVDYNLLQKDIKRHKII